MSGRSSPNERPALPSSPDEHPAPASPVGGGPTGGPPATMSGLSSSHDCPAPVSALGEAQTNGRPAGWPARTNSVSGGDAMRESSTCHTHLVPCVPPFRSPLSNCGSFLPAQVATMVRLPSSLAMSASSTPSNNTIGPTCYYGMAALMDTSWPGINLGRRYARCPLDEVGDHCRFVEWIDPEWDEGSLRALTALREVKDAAESAMLSRKRQTRILTDQNLRQIEEVGELQTEVWQLKETA